MTVISCSCTMTSACVDYGFSYSANVAKLLSRARAERVLLMTWVPNVPVSRELHVGNNIIWWPW
jgi:hypothetical protein